MKTSQLAVCILLNVANAGEQIPEFLTLAERSEYAEIVWSGKKPTIISEKTFLTLQKKPGAIVLDTQHTVAYEQLHVNGAVNLPFGQLGRSSLARIIPNRRSTILLYVPINLRPKASDPVKSASPSWSFQLYAILRIYGYTDIYALDPKIHLPSTKILLDGVKTKKIQNQSGEPWQSVLHP